MSRRKSLSISIGTKRGITPYWRRYRLGKKQCLSCPLHDVCLELASNDKRQLYFHGYFCKDMEGFTWLWFAVEQDYLTKTYRKRPFEEVRKRIEEIDWARKDLEYFQQMKDKILREKGKVEDSI